MALEPVMCSTNLVAELGTELFNLAQYKLCYQSILYYCTIFVLFCSVMYCQEWNQDFRHAQQEVTTDLYRIFGKKRISLSRGRQGNSYIPIYTQRNIYIFIHTERHIQTHIHRDKYVHIQRYRHIYIYTQRYIFMHVYTERHRHTMLDFFLQQIKVNENNHILRLHNF